MDQTARLMNQSKKKMTNHPDIYFTRDPVYNINDVDGKDYMFDHRMSGCYSIACKKKLSESHPGKYYVNGQYAGEPILNQALGRQNIGLYMRQWLTEYDITYQIRVEGLVTEIGEELEPFEFAIHTQPNLPLGEEFPEHDELVLNAAREGAVLLKNEGDVLPLPQGSTLNAFGSGTASYRLGCVGAGRINPRYGIRFKEGIEKYTSLKLNRELVEFYRNERDVLPPESLMKEAKKRSDTAIFVVSRPTGESEDTLPIQGEYYLTEDEKSLMLALRATFRKLVVILNTGYPIELGWIDHADAILWVGLNGMAGGRALGEILDGQINPSGRLPDTWAIDYQDIPAMRNALIADKECIRSHPRALNERRPYNIAVYEEGLYVGYRYFNTFQIPVAFPFGHGLHYTQFMRECVRFYCDSSHLEIDIKVTNTGSRMGKESILLFAQLPEGKLEQPSRRLIDFGKTQDLQPGESEVIKMCIDIKTLKSYDAEKASWVIEPGEVVLYLGGSVEEAEEQVRFLISEYITVKKVKNRVYPPFEVKELSRHAVKETYPTGTKSEIIESVALPYRRERNKTQELRTVKENKPKNIVTFPMVVDDHALLDSFVSQMTDYELCRCSVGAKPNWGYGENGCAGLLYSQGALAKYELPDAYYFADGNNGLNMYHINIGFPVSNVVCATFNEHLAYLEGRAIGKEALALGVSCVLAPAANLHRSPLCGRYSEYFSEDPLLAGRMAGNEGLGLQSRGIGSSLKHLFANSTEYLRSENHAIMSERTARELYLGVFEHAFNIYMPTSIMTGYNAANGVWCTEDEELLEGILREEWGFEGYIMTDWGGSNSCAGGAPAQAGLTWIAPGGMDDSFVAPILDALREGRLDRQRLLANVRDMIWSMVIQSEAREREE